MGTEATNGGRPSLSPFFRALADVRFGSKADIGEGATDVRFTPKRDMDQHGRDVRFVPKRTFTDPHTGTKLIRQCRDRYYFNCEVGMRERSDPD